MLRKNDENAKLKKGKNRISFPLQIVIILLLGVALSIASYFIVKDISVKDSASKHIVTFAYLDGTVIEKKVTKDGKGVIPPAIEYTGAFRGWNTAINDVKSDIEAHPMFTEIVNDNLFYFHSVYAKEKDKFTVTLMLGGSTVEVSDGEITLQYDTDVMEYVEVKNTDSCTVTKISNGQISISIHTNGVLSTETKLADIIFRAKPVDAYSTELLLSGKEMVINKNGNIKNVDFATLNNKIYFLQEVK